MSTLIFDFDSTLITLESLEEILADKLAGRPEVEAEIRRITKLGMEGLIGFGESLSRRLAAAEPHLRDVQRFGERAVDLLTPGMEEVVRDLKEEGIRVLIISGGLREAILPVAAHLGVPDEDVHAVRLLWRDDTFAGIDPDDPFSISKVAGAKAVLCDLPAPKIAVGDGMTDYHLLRDGLVDHFIAFTQHVRREPLVATGVPEADSVAQLKTLLEQWL